MNLTAFSGTLKYLIEEAYFKPDPQHKTEGILVEAVAEALSELAPSHKRLPDNIFNMYFDIVFTFFILSLLFF